MKLEGENAEPLVGLQANLSASQQGEHGMEASADDVTGLLDAHEGREPLEARIRRGRYRRNGLGWILKQDHEPALST